MHVNRYCVKNFRRLEQAEINLDKEETVFVGSNNAGKTSATAALKLFVMTGSFKIHDFSSNLIIKIDKFGKNFDETKDFISEDLPEIELDIWFTIDPKTEYGRVAYLLPKITEKFVEVGMNLKFCATDVKLMMTDYRKACLPEVVDGVSKQKPLSFFLELNNNLKKYFSIVYSKIQIEKDGDKTKQVFYPLEAKEGQAAIASLIRVDFVEAQRNIDDDASSRSNRLSSVFYDFYTSNLKQYSTDSESIKVIEKTNESLSDHYEQQFFPLMEIIGELGFPTINDRDLRVISNLSAEKALSGNAALSYFEKETSHMLPEAYNGLGFKNLVYIAIQIAHFQIQWLSTDSLRPMCQIIIVEEPEVHLHAQVQQTFLKQIRKVIEKTVSKDNSGGFPPQLILTTHSSHIVAGADFKKIRYFRKIVSNYTIIPLSAKRVATEVLDLSRFDDSCEEKENIDFLKKYIALTHCDLFFADAAIIVEGTVERLLLPTIIKRVCPNLDTKYLTILELGGAYAHKFSPLFKFLNLSSLIITDLDSVDPKAKNSSCIADHTGAVTSNACIKSFLLAMDKEKSAEEQLIYDESRKVSSVVNIPSIKKIVQFEKSSLYVAFQTPVDIVDPLLYGGFKQKFTPRTFEESFIYHNMLLIKNKNIDANFDFDIGEDSFVDYYKIYSSVNNKFKKVEFVLSIVSSPDNWAAPDYIIDGLNWLAGILK